MCALPSSVLDMIWAVVAGIDASTAPIHPEVNITSIVTYVMAIPQIHRNICRSLRQHDCLTMLTHAGPIVPCGPEHQKCIAAADKPKYTFHLADPTCDINDPNGPMYDPVHGVYHNFYQIHIAENMNGAGDGPDWGHWVSKDFIHWAQLPVAIWNDR